MKKTITLLSGLLFCISISAQINSNLNNNQLKAINDKVMMSGDEALSHLMVNPNPNTSSTPSAKTKNTTETVIGTTTYDLQSNAAVQNRILVHHDGTISAGWTMSKLYNTAWADRGTGYNFFDGTSWLPDPMNRLESGRTGWPSILKTGSGKEISMAHNTDNSYVQMTYRAATGSGTWAEQIVSSQDSSGVYRYMIWNRSAVGGINNETIHMIAVTASTNFNGTPFNGIDGALVYYRSQDEGLTWDKKDVQLPSLDSSNFIAMSGDVYSIDAKGETVVIAYFDDWGDSFILKSTDNGDTWTRTTFLDFPVRKYAVDAGFDLDDNDTTDHMYSTDNYGCVILDANNQAHVVYGVMQYADDDLADGSSSWYPGTNMLAYWNESFGADNYLDSTYSSYPSYTVNGVVIDTLYYSVDTIFTNQWDTVTNSSIQIPTTHYQIIHFNDPNNPTNPTDTTWGWEANITTNVYDSIGNIDTTILLSADTTIIHNYNVNSTYFTVPNNTTLQDTIDFVDAAGIATPRGRWWSDMMNDHIIATAPDLNGDGAVDGIDSTGGYALYYASRASMPNIGISSNGEIYVSFSGYTETADNGTQVFRHIYITKSSDGGLTWRNPVDVTPHDVWNGAQECVFGSMNKVVDGKIRMVYQKDFEPGLAVRGDEDLTDNNEIIYIEIDTVGLFDAPLNIQEIAKNTEFNIYPNPSNNEINLQISSSIDEEINISISDIFGKKIYTENQIISNGINLNKINIEKISNGIYFVNTRINGEDITRKIIVNK